MGRRLFKNWHLSVIGSTLVLMSSVLSGLWIYRIQNSIDATRSEIVQRDRDLESSTRERDQSSLVSTISLVQHRLAMTTSLDKHIDSLWDEVLATSLAEANVRMAVAAGKSDDPKVQQLIASAKKAASEGDRGEASYAVLNALLAEVGENSKKIGSDITGKNYILRQLERKRSKIYAVSLIVQMLGLVVLLIKETPYFLEKKREVS